MTFNLQSTVLSLFVTNLVGFLLLFYKISILEQKIEVSENMINALQKKSQSLQIEENLTSIIEPATFLGGENLILLFSAMSFFATMLFFKKNFDVLFLVQKQQNEIYAQNVIVQKNLGDIGNNLANLIMVESDMTQEILSNTVQLLP